eukprot:1158603-Pelagomonas_calceolata.AAC.5
MRSSSPSPGALAEGPWEGRRRATGCSCAAASPGGAACRGCDCGSTGPCAAVAVCTAVWALGKAAAAGCTAVCALGKAVGFVLEGPWQGPCIVAAEVMTAVLIAVGSALFNGYGSSNGGGCSSSVAAAAAVAAAACHAALPDRG